MGLPIDRTNASEPRRRRGSRPAFFQMDGVPP
jgi:hypothetical protein